MVSKNRRRSVGGAFVLALLLGSSAAIPQVFKCLPVGPDDPGGPVEPQCRGGMMYVMGKDCFPPSFNC
jgi:hypothetical protein